MQWCSSVRDTDRFARSLRSVGEFVVASARSRTLSGTHHMDSQQHFVLHRVVLHTLLNSRATGSFESRLAERSSMKGRCRSSTGSGMVKRAGSLG